MNNSPDLSNGINSSEESDFHVYFKRTVRNFQHKWRYISKGRSLFVVNIHRENQATFSKVPIFPGDKSYSDAVAKEIEQKNIMSFRGNILTRIKMCDFNKAFKDRKAKYLNLSGTTWKQLLQYLDLNLKI